jgi:hypothetical protein
LGAKGPAAPKTGVQRWEARGVGPPARQGVACLDVNDDATRIALGAVAPPGDPNVLLLDGDGKLLRQQRAGQRWINQVALRRDNALWAVCTMPAGRSGDLPEAFRLSSGAVDPPEAVDWRRGQYADAYFHYGDHSNHVTRLLTGYGDSPVVLDGDQVHWLGAAGKTTTFPLQPAAIPVAVAAGPGGVVVVGTTAAPSKQEGAPPNLHVLGRSRPKPLWGRPLNTATATAPRPEKGRYGTPTLPDGRREELPQRDEKVWAPLAVAVHAEGPGGKRLVAAADYQGWQRWVRSSATGPDENLGVRFMPARPAVTVYDEDGKAVRRFGPDTFARPFWCDLRSSPEGKRLLAWPHSWTSRGLAGQATLPADDDAGDLYVLEVGTGKVTRLTFPGALSDVAVSERGVAAGCWDGRVYLLGDDGLAKGRVPAGVAVGGPSLVRTSRDGSRAVVAVTAGLVSLLEPRGRSCGTPTSTRLPSPTSSRGWTMPARCPSPKVDGSCPAAGSRATSAASG